MRRMRYLLSFCTAAACAALLYGLSVRFPNPLTQVLFPVNGSPWELGKLALWPGSCAALVLRRLGGGSRSGLCAAVLLSVGAAMALGAAELSPVLVCPLAAAVGLIAYALALRRLRGGELLWYTALILLSIACILFTILPPSGALFTDPADVSVVAPIPF